MTQGCPPMGPDTASGTEAVLTRTTWHPDGPLWGSLQGQSQGGGRRLRLFQEPATATLFLERAWARRWAAAGGG